MPMTQKTATLTQDDRRALEIVADPARAESPARAALEKLSRLKLIEPCPQGVCVTLAGTEVLRG